VRAKATGRKEPSKKGPFVAGQPTVTAKFAGRCKLCGGMIGVGATITLVGEAWVHEKCAPK
jgi:hypothetical protein